MNSTGEDKTNELIRPPPIYIAFRYVLLPMDQGTGVSFLCMGEKAKLSLLKTSILKKPRIKK